MMSLDELIERSQQQQTGLRFYYRHLATAALKSALVGGAIDGKRDSECVAALSKWLASAEVCNTRFAMAELLLFFLPSTVEAMQERLQLHIAITAGPSVRQRRSLTELVESLKRFQQEGLLPVESGKHLSDIGMVMRRYDKANEVAEEVEKLLRE